MYFSNSLKIINDIKETIIKMHNAGVAMCDLQPQNILVDDNQNIKVIDLETATDVNACQKSSMATKGYYDKRNTTGKDKDWYSLNRIFQYMLLPIGPVYDFDMKINTIHCQWIKEQFGKDNFEKFILFQENTLKHISQSEKIFGSTYKDYLVDDMYDMTLETAKNRMLNGLICNCNDKSKSLINGDIRQFENDCGLFNLLTGGFGAITILNKYKYNSSTIRNWIKNALPILMSTDYNFGLLTGRSGIACTLFESGYVEEAKRLMNLIIGTYDINTKDMTLRSGLSGLGLSLVAFFIETNNTIYLKEAEKMASIITEKISNGVPLLNSDWESSDIGLIDGYSGISLLFSVLYKYTKKEEYYYFSKKMILMDLERTFNSDRDGSLQTLDNNKLLPYLRNGSIGIGVAISVLNNVCEKQDYIDELSAILKVSDYRCCYEASFFDGIGGFFLCQCIDKSEKDYMKKIYNKLKLFLTIKDDKVFLPAKYFYKLSMDMYSGNTGILASIYSAEKKNPLGWLPLINNLYL